MAERNLSILAHCEWLDALDELSLSCAVDAPDEAHERIREINALLLVAPARSLIEGLQPMAVSRLEALIDADACETAVITMLASGAGFLLSRGADGQSLATIALPGDQREASGAGASPALALIGALAQALTRTAADERAGGRSAWLDTSPALH